VKIKSKTLNFLLNIYANIILSLFVIGQLYEKIHFTYGKLFRRKKSKIIISKFNNLIYN
jgi:hypothetical protein